MTEMAVRPNAATAPPTHPEYGVTAASATTPGPIRMIAKDQAYFWTAAWQDNEAAASQELADGDAVTFDDPREALRWLLSDDDA